MTFKRGQSTLDLNYQAADADADPCCREMLRAKFLFRFVVVIFSESNDKAKQDIPNYVTNYD